MSIGPNSQTALVLDMLKDGPITSMDAIRELGCTRLAAHIKFLRDDGIVIRTVRESSVNRWGKTVSYAVYQLEEAPVASEA